MKNSTTNQDTSVAIQLDNYIILEKIGEGGYGVLYKAEQLSTGQTVAIKMLKLKEHLTPKSKQQQIARFDRETQLCAEINHPNIVKLLDKGYTEYQEPFAVFEYIAGQTLKDLILQHRGLPAEKTGELMGQVLEALAYAHAKGIVHRDLKPHNIMVASTAVRSHAKILDFGIGAFTLDFRANDYKSLTMTQEVVGTPAYCAPEQLRGEPTTEKSDLYAWGLIVLECLTGQPVIQADSIAEIFQQQLSANDVPLPIYIAGHPLATILRKVLHKDPRQRIAKAASIFEEYTTINFNSIVGQIQSQNTMSLAKDEATVVNQLAWRSIHSEKRQITVLSAKLSLSIADNNTLDIETLETFQKDQLQRCKDTGIRFGAYISGILADTIIMYFGYPQGTDNDARRAGRTALELISELQKRSTLLQSQHGIGLEIRVGIHSGTVLVKPKSVPEGLVTNIAFNLLHATPSGQILVSEITKKLLDPHLEFEDFQANNTTSGIQATKAYLLTGERQTEALSNLSPWSADQKMIGREIEQEQLLQLWKSVQPKNGKATLIKGQAGIGKSKLIYESKKQLINQGFIVRECRCLSEYQNNALHPIFEMLKSHWGIHDTNESIIPALEHALQNAHCDSETAMPVLCSWFTIPKGDYYQPSEATPAEQKEILFRTLEHCILNIGASKKFMLIVEDLHWVDPTSLEFINHLLKNVPQENYFLLLTSRPEFESGWDSGQIITMELQTLTKAYTKNLIEGILHQKNIDSSALDYIVGRTDGIPLFIEDLTRMLLDQQDLIVEEDTCRLSDQFDEQSVPISLKGLLNARLDRLGLAKETAQLASAIGREFSYDLLVASSLYDEHMIQADLNALLEANLIYRHRRIQNEMYLFRHALIRDAAYDGMVSLLRKETHGRIAVALEHNSQEITQDNPFELARHLAEAEHHEKASQLGLEAIKKHIKNSANEEALTLRLIVHKWIANIQKKHQKIESELILNDLILPAQMAISGYGSKEVLQINKRNEELIEKIQEDNTAVSNDMRNGVAHKIEWGLFLNYHFQSKRQKASKIARNILHKLEVNPNREIEVGVLPLISNAFHADGKLDDAEELCHRIFEIYNAATDVEIGINYSMEPKSSAHYLLSSIYLFKGKPEEAEKEVKKAITWGEKIKHSVTITLAYLFYTLLAYFLDDKELVKNIVAQHDALHDDKSDGNWVTMHLKMINAWSTGETAYAENYVTNILSSKQYYALSWYEPSLAETYRDHGDIEKAIQLMEKSLARSLHDGEFWGLSLTRRVLAECYYAKYNTLNEKIETQFEQSIEDANNIGAHWFELNAIVSYGTILLKEHKGPKIKNRLEAIFATMKEGKQTKLYKKALALKKSLS